MKHIFWMAWNPSYAWANRKERDYNAHLSDNGIRRTFSRDAETPKIIIGYPNFLSVPMQAERAS